MKKTETILICSLLAMAAATSCVERHPDNFGEISSVYFNNRVQGNILADTTEVTFIYEASDHIEVPVTVQLLGRPAGHDRPVDISVSSENAAEGMDYRLPSEENAVLPAGETSFIYTVTLIRTDALQTEEKSLTLELHPNEHFTLSLTQLEQTTDTVSTLDYTIVFSDMFTEAPAAWDASILGEFSQTKFELICDVLSVDPASFNDATVMTLPRQMYIYNEITDYIDAEIRKMNAGEDYDTRIIDPTTGEPVEFPN